MSNQAVNVIENREQNSSRLILLTAPQYVIMIDFSKFHAIIILTWCFITSTLSIQDQVIRYAFSTNAGTQGT